MPAPGVADVVVIGAGMVGAACTYFLAREGLSVVTVDRGGVVAGTTGAGEGNILVSDKAAGPELDLALLSIALWQELAPELGAVVELDPKGGLVVAPGEPALAGLTTFAHAQRAAGVTAIDVTADDLPDLEPHLAAGFAGGVHYPQDMQVQPMLAAAHLLRLARDHGTKLATGTEVTGIGVTTDRVCAVHTTAGTIATRNVVNAAGTWSGDIAQLAGVDLPILPRRGFILVTEPLPPMVRHKVYTAEYVGNVASSDAGLETSTVVEGTASGTILIGASRERVGFDRTMSLPVLAKLAAGAVELFPFLADVRAMRSYLGFRPYCPDHLPVIGADARVSGLFHACGHEGAGIGLAPATGRLVAQAVTGTATELPLEPFAPTRFAVAHA